MNKIEKALVSIQLNMYNFAYSLTLNRDDANDLLQDTSLKVLDNQEKFTDDVNFKGWVMTIMKNIFINHYRQIVRNQTVLDVTENLYHLNISQSSGLESPEGQYVTKEISESINHFPTDFSKPFSMHVEGYKYEEIAKDMNIPIGTVKSRIFMARKRLQEEYKDYR